MLRDIGEPGKPQQLGLCFPVLTAPGAATEPFPQTAQRWHSLATYNLLESHTSTSGSGAGPGAMGPPCLLEREVGPVPLHATTVVGRALTSQASFKKPV